MKQQAPLDSISVDDLLSEAVAAILRAPDAEQFLRWGRERIPLALASVDALDADDTRRLAALLAQAIWNAVPRPDLNFRASPLAEPAPTDPCRCGSGAAYGDCCAAAGEVPELPSEILWDPLLDQLSEAQLQAAVHSGSVPRPLLAKVADRWLALERPGRAVALLEPLFDADVEQLDEAFEPALDILCDAYDVLDHWKKKQAFLLRMTDAAPAPLKSAAWQRLSVMFIDEGDFDYAADAFAQAQRHGPEHPGTALLEITLLAARHRDEHARARALFWQHKLRRAGHDGSGIYEFLERAREDPQQALMLTQAASMDPALLRLRDWLATLPGRALPALTLEPIDDPLSCGDSRQLPLFDPELLPLPPTAGGSGACCALTPARALLGIERGWRQVFPAGKPLSTLLVGPEHERAWLHDEWLDYVEANPQSADSLEVLDDLATALYAHPESSLPWVARVMLDPLLDRAEAMLRHAVGPGTPSALPWTDPRNRPALRLLFRRYRQHVDAGDDDAARELLELLLALNPRDNHGVRAELMNHYLRAGEDEKALALARRFPTDALADLAYGEVLALYRLGQQERAALVLHEAVGRLPRVPRFLLRKRVRRPALHQGAFAPGGDDQAWLYREAMRDVWAAEPGLLAWMKKLTA
jgi:tetratricopeptide (TPR) repeat protein